MFCVAHGGGKKCLTESCLKSARGSTLYCVSHGGGKRCAVNKCPKSAEGSTSFCRKHGGGRKCSQVPTPPNLLKVIWGLEHFFILICFNSGVKTVNGGLSRKFCFQNACFGV
jgi:hypothetical protein